MCSSLLDDLVVARRTRGQPRFANGTPLPRRGLLSPSGLELRRRFLCRTRPTHQGHPLVAAFRFERAPRRPRTLHLGSIASRFVRSRSRSKLRGGPAIPVLTPVHRAPARASGQAADQFGASEEDGSASIGGPPSASQVGDSSAAGRRLQGAPTRSDPRRWSGRGRMRMRRSGTSPLPAD